jgi:virulence factor Mce-like protein
MRRPLIAGLLLTTALIAAVVLIVGGGSAGSYRFAAMFDTAKGMVAGQQVKIAGAVAGTVDDVQLAAGPKARMVMTISRRFAPFRADATCSILPEGLISENYVECDPGRAPAALSQTGGLPMVPLAQTTVPVSLQDVLNVFSLPTDERLRLLISELGIGTAGRGGDINNLLRRANPALTQSQRVLRILDAQRQRIAGAVVSTDAVLGQLAVRGDSIRGFVDRAATVAATTAQHARALSATVAALPGMLEQARPGLRALDNAAASASPLLRSLHRAAPSLVQLTATLPAFLRAGTPALDALPRTAAVGRPALRAAAPVIGLLNATARPVSTLAHGLDALLASTRDSGGFEGVLRVAYAFAINTSLYDSLSHIVSFSVSLAPLCIAGQQAGFSVPGCSRAYTSAGGGAIPVNEPSCGPKSGAWFDQRCPPATPGPIVGFAKRKAGTPQLRRLQALVDRELTGAKVAPGKFTQLLDYLLR